MSSAEGIEMQIPEGASKLCCQCGAVIVHHKCASCGHEECAADGYWKPKPSYEELEAQNSKLIEALIQVRV